MTSDHLAFVDNIFLGRPFTKRYIIAKLFYVEFRAVNGNVFDNFRSTIKDVVAKVPIRDQDLPRLNKFIRCFFHLHRIVDGESIHKVDFTKCKSADDFDVAYSNLVKEVPRMGDEQIVGRTMVAFDKFNELIDSIKRDLLSSEFLDSNDLWLYVKYVDPRNSSVDKRWDIYDSIRTNLRLYAARKSYTSIIAILDYLAVAMRNRSPQDVYKARDDIIKWIFGSSGSTDRNIYELFDKLIELYKQRFGE
jgi:hypothetical protein